MLKHTYIVFIYEVVTSVYIYACAYTHRFHIYMYIYTHIIFYV